MDLKLKLAEAHSVRISKAIQHYVKSDRERFQRLVAILLGEDRKLAQRAALAVNWCFDYDSKPFEECAPRLIAAFLSRSDLHVAVRRCIIRNLQIIEIPRADQARLYDRCLMILHQEDQTVAIKAFSMQVAFNICESFPALKRELKEAIRLNLESNGSPGVQSRGRKLIKKLAEA